MNNKYILEKLCNGENLTYDEAYEMMDMMMKGTLNPSFVAALLTALKIKGETVNEISACAAYEPLFSPLLFFHLYILQPY